jgi:hypothetical protein
LAEVDFEAEVVETYICGNPPYRGYSLLTDLQKSDVRFALDGKFENEGFLDYISGWFSKASRYGSHTPTACALVSTNSICQGQVVSILWHILLQGGHEIAFAYSSFKWSNLASNNAGVTVVIIGLSINPKGPRRLFNTDENGAVTVREVANINAYLVPAANVIVEKRSGTLSGLTEMDYGSKPVDGGNLLLAPSEIRALNLTAPERERFVRRFAGAEEAIIGTLRYCLWIGEADASFAEAIPAIASRLKAVAISRLASTKSTTRGSARTPYAFQQVRQSGLETPIIIPIHSSENREFLPVGYLPKGSIVSNAGFALLDAPLWNLALITSRIHLVWIATVCGKLETRYRYSNTLGWNTFPVPTLTEKNKADLSRCAEDILAAREAHFPSTIADLYDSNTMPDDLRAAHERNDETLERIYIGRRFRNDTERLEKLFDLYAKMTAEKLPKKSARKGAA